jgi:hypothetical protein
MKRGGAINDIYIIKRRKGPTLKVTDRRQKGANFLKIILGPDPFRDLNKGIQLKKLLILQGIILIERIKLLILQLHRIQELTNRYGQLQLFLHNLILRILPRNSHCRGLDLFTRWNYGEHYLLGLGRVFYGRVGYLEPF